MTDDLVLTVDRKRTAGLLDPQDKFYCPTLLTGDSFAYLTLRQQDETMWQFGAHGFGQAATALTDDVIGLVTAWDHRQRAGDRPQITVYPAGTRLPPTETSRLPVPRRHTLVAITWSGAGR